MNNNRGVSPGETQEAGHARGPSTDRQKHTDHAAIAGAEASPAALRRIRKLEDELRESSKSLQTTIEELQSTNEALRTVNQALSVKGSEAEHANGQLRRVNQQLAQEVKGHRQTETRLAEQEKKLRTIIDAEPAWVNICNLDGTIIEVNPAGVETMEAGSVDNLIGKRLEDFVMPEFAGKLHRCRDTMSGEGPARHEIEVRTLKGKTRWLEVSAVMLPGGGPRELQIMSIICDQTERKQARDEAARRQMKLAQAARLNVLGEMTTGLAHELNQPLSAIRNYVNGCQRRIEQDGCNNAEVLKVLRLTAEQAQRAGEILNHVRSFVRQEGDFIQTAIDINQVVRDAVRLLQETGQVHGVKLISKLEEPLPVVLANSVQIEQVMINLIRNGIEAMEMAGVQAPRLAIYSHQSDDGAIHVAVEDQGGGLPEEHKDEIFKPLYTTKKNGMGVGLSISRTIIESHAGHLQGENNNIGGATFTFTLPSLKEEQDD